MTETSITKKIFQDVPSDLVSRAELFVKIKKMLGDLDNSKMENLKLIKGYILKLRKINPCTGNLMVIDYAHNQGCYRIFLFYIGPYRMFLVLCYGTRLHQRYFQDIYFVENKFGSKIFTCSTISKFFENPVAPLPIMISVKS